MSSMCSIPIAQPDRLGPHAGLSCSCGDICRCVVDARMAGQRFRVADVDQPLEQFQRVVETLAGFEPSGHAKSQQRTRPAAEVFLRQRMIGAVVKPGVVHPSDAAVAAQKLRNILGIFDVPLDPQRDTLDALKQQKGAERRKHRSHGALIDTARALDIGAGAELA